MPDRRLRAHSQSPTLMTERDMPVRVMTGQPLGTLSSLDGYLVWASVVEQYHATTKRH